MSTLYLPDRLELIRYDAVNAYTTLLKAIAQLDKPDSPLGTEELLNAQNLYDDVASDILNLHRKMKRGAVTCGL